jgi:cbb3-type cytochrome oxidase subunit 3
MSGWPTALTIFLVLVGTAYTWFMYTAVKKDDEEQHRTQGNPQP